MGSSPTGDTINKWSDFEKLEKEFLEYECKIIKNSRVLKIDILADSLDLYVETIYDNKVRTVKFNV